MSLHPCTTCRRHVRVDARECPFCGAAQAAPSPRGAIPIVGTMSRAAVFAGLTACWTSNKGAADPPPPPPPPPTLPADAAVAEADPATPDVPPDAPNAPILGGTVIDKFAKTPLASATVELHDAKGKVASVNADGSGRYAFGTLVAGDYQLVVRYNTNYGVGSAQVPVSVRDRPQQVDVPVPVTRRAPIPKPYGAPPARRRIT